MLTPEDFSECRESSTTGVGLFKDGEIHPSAYFRFAEEDLAEDDSPRSRVNALSNAKRALHLQIESLTDALGYLRWSDPGPRNFLRRIRFLEKCGLITPGIVAKVNRLRNEVEHEYLMPSAEVVRDYVDVVGLYLGASERYVAGFPHMRELYTGTGQARRTYSLCTKRASGEFRLYDRDNITLIRAWPEANVVTPRDAPDAQIPRGIEPIVLIDLCSDEVGYFAWARILLGKRP